MKRNYESFCFQFEKSLRQKARFFLLSGILICASLLQSKADHLKDLSSEANKVKEKLATTITGTITDASTGEPIIGATVSIEGTTKGTITDVKGKYSIEVANPDQVLVFSYVGYTQVKIKVADQTVIDVKLTPEIKALDEVVVVGYGTLKKSDLTGSVSQIKATDFDAKPATSIDNLLQGKIAGLQVMSSSGEPGSQATIRIRGNNSFTNNGDNNSPLYVVDNIPIGDAGNLYQVNPNDIESIDILKDASATAIYGSRGANGVIMITTKRGKMNQQSIEFSSQTSISNLAKPFDIISDPLLYAELDNEAHNNANKLFPGQYPAVYVGAKYLGTYYPSPDQIASGEWKYKTYWPDVVFRTGITNNQSVAARGGNEKTTYAVSLGYTDQTALVIGNHYNKYTADIKLDEKIFNNVTVGIDSKMALTKERKSNAGGSWGRSPVFPVDSNGVKYVRIGLNDFGNPLAIANEITNKNQTYDLYNTGYLDWEIVKGLTLHSNLSYKYGEAIGDYYEPRLYGGTGYLFNGYGQTSTFTGKTFVNDNYLTFKKTLQKHDITLMAGSSYENYQQWNNNLQGRGFVNDILANQNLSNATTQLVTNSYFKTVLNSYFGRAVYGFADRYLFTFTMRADGSSKFGASNKWGYFPSAAVGWNVNNESFFPKNALISTLKLRGSWGITGAQTIAAYQTLDRLGDSKYYSNSGTYNVGYGPGQYWYQDQQSQIFYLFGNPTLKWETTRQYDFGTDISLFNNKINLTIDYYDKLTNGMLRTVLIPISSGYDGQQQNSGKVSNKGFEFALDGSVIRSKDFSWDLGATFSINKNEVIDHGSSSPDAIGPLQEQFRGYTNYLIDGQPIGTYWGYKTDGIIQNKAEGVAAGLTGAMAQPGEIKYLNYNKGDSGKVILGSPEAKFVYAFNTKVTMYGFDLSASFQGSYGNKEINLNRMGQGSTQFQRWTPDNPSNKYPSLNTGRAVYFSDWWIEDASYLKIQNIALGYNLYLQKGIKKIRVYASCDNVWTFTKFSGYDPELAPTNVQGTNLNNSFFGLNNVGYPRPRVFTFGLNLTF